jgi:nicotinate-nucleotide adenylyltransferase
MKIGIFGGTFDPIHLGHTAVAREIRRQAGLDAVHILPCHRPPHKARADLTPGADRLAMIALASQDDPALVPSSFELVRPAPSYTIDTLRALRSRRPGDRFYFLLGMDSFLEIDTWKEADRLLDECHLIVVNRGRVTVPLEPEALPAAARGRVSRGTADVESDAGRVHVLDLETYAVSSSEIREQARQGADLGRLVAAPVASYIQRCALYR